MKNGCPAATEESELNTTPDGQVLQVLSPHNDTEARGEEREEAPTGELAWLCTAGQGEGSDNRCY